MFLSFIWVFIIRLFYDPIWPLWNSAENLQFSKVLDFGLSLLTLVFLPGRYSSELVYLTVKEIQANAWEYLQKYQSCFIQKIVCAVWNLILEVSLWPVME